MTRKLAIATVLSLAAWGTLYAPAARADVIDGDWCSGDGRHLAIRGSKILTPGGNQITGDYTRHSFNYVIPPNEKDAGQTVAMLLLNEETVRITPRPGAQPEVWLRCKVQPSV
jgi:hypothetical protein